MTEYHPRDIADAVNAALENMPVVVVTGMRQTDKTTFLCSQPDLVDRIYVSFDDFAQLEAAKSNPEEFVSRSETLTIDETHFTDKPRPFLMPIVYRIIRSAG